MKVAFLFATWIFFVSGPSEAHGPEASGPGAFSSTHPAHLADADAPPVENSSASPSLRQQEAPLPEWEIRTAPVAFIAKWFTADLSYTLDKQFSLGPSMIIYNGPEDGGGIEYRHRNERQVIFENNVTTVENYVDAQGYPFVEYKIGVLF